MTATTAAIETPIHGLYATPPTPLPFAPALHIRSFLLRRYQDKRKRVNLDETLGKPAAEAEELDAAERKRRLEERRKEADGKAVDLN